MIIQILLSNSCEIERQIKSNRNKTLTISTIVGQIYFPVKRFSEAFNIIIIIIKHDTLVCVCTLIYNLCVIHWCHNIVNNNNILFV